ncbi:MAG TPA: ribosome biogenesis GTPase Der [Hyphomicrobiales bacterium]|nr:ribosome biogenesis GTPase Der [Hyphomicrobiales bacterium]
MLPIVAIVGRPNVGKSTLFNRLVGKRLALVDDTPGVTRDRREGEARIADLDFLAVDTAGLEDAAAGSLAARMRAQTDAALRTADVILFMVDARAGVTPEDERFAALLRRGGKPVIVLANKAEGRGGAGALEAFRLGLGDPVALSAEHGEGLDALYEALKAALPQEEDEAAGEDSEEPAERPAGPLGIAIVGRPNAGKSTLVNRLVGEERVLTGPEAGITRDAIAIDWEWRGRPVRLADTAGIRRRARVEAKLEKLAVADALRAIRYAEVVVLLLDATAPFEKQDLHIAALVEREGRALVVALDKWDLIENPQAELKRHRDEIDRLLPQVKGVALVTVSGVTGQGVDRLMQAVFAAAAVWNRRIPTAELNRWLEGALAAHPPPAVRGSRLKLRYMTQTKARPPHFILFGTRTDALPDAYVRYLVNGLRETFDLPGTPIRMSFREPKNPYDPGKGRG